MKKSPVIAGVKDLNKFDDALNSPCQIIFLLSGSIFNIKEIVSKAKEKNKIIFIHVDLLDGFSKDAVALKYIYEEIRPDGKKKKKNSQLKAAKAMGVTESAIAHSIKRKTRSAGYYWSYTEIKA